MRTSNKYKNILQNLRQKLKIVLIFKNYLKLFHFYYKVHFFVRNFIKDLIFTSTMQKKKSPQIIDSKEGEVVERTSTCQKCQNEGLSNEKLTKIENFKDVTISESACKNCGFEQKLVDFVEKKNDFGIEIFYQVQHSIDG